ncbi:hypothetical protein F4604DRAFT_2044490 [Suillus subluteus]|nr:hypothetical protein F4604DRAFT_2044490 [Suillus subluteus]
MLWKYCNLFVEMHPTMDHLRETRRLLLLRSVRSSAFGLGFIPLLTVNEYESLRGIAKYEDMLQLEDKDLMDIDEAYGGDHPMDIDHESHLMDVDDIGGGQEMVDMDVVDENERDLMDIDDAFITLAVERAGTSHFCNCLQRNKYRGRSGFFRQRALPAPDQSMTSTSNITMHMRPTLCIAVEEWVAHT